MRIVSALCLMLISTGCHANDIMQGHWESSRPSAGRKANGHFGANMVLTASESQVRRDWVKYKANPRIPSACVAACARWKIAHGKEPKRHEGSDAIGRSLPRENERFP